MDTDDSLDRVQEAVQELREEVRAVREHMEHLRGKTDLDPLLTRQEAADRLGVSVRTLDDMAEAGEIQPVRIRRRVLYSQATLQAYIRRNAGGGER